MPKQGPNGKIIYTTDEKRELLAQLVELGRKGHQHLAYADPEFKEILGKMVDAEMLTDCPSGVHPLKRNLGAGVGISNLVIRVDKKEDPAILIGVPRGQDRYNPADGINVSQKNALNINHFGLAMSVSAERFLNALRSDPPEKPNGFLRLLDSILTAFGGSGFESCRKYDQKLQEYEAFLREIPGNAGYSAEEIDRAKSKPVKENSETVKEKVNECNKIYNRMLQKYSGDVSLILEDVDTLDEQDELEFVSKMMACVECKKLLNADPPQYKKADAVEKLGLEWLVGEKYKNAVALIRQDAAKNARFVKALASGNADEIFEALAGKTSDFKKALKDTSEIVQEPVEESAKSSTKKEATATQPEKKAEASKQDTQKILKELLQRAHLVQMKQNLVQKNEASQREAMKEAEKLQSMQHHKVGKSKEKQLNERAKERAFENLSAPTEFDTYFDVLEIKEKMAPLISEALVGRMAAGQSTLLNKECGNVAKMNEKQRAELQKELTGKLLGDVKNDVPLSKMLNMLASSKNLVDMLKGENPVAALTNGLIENYDAARAEVLEEARKEQERKDKPLIEAESKRNYHYIEDDRADILITLKGYKNLQQKEDHTFAEKHQMEIFREDICRLTANAISKEFFQNRVATGQAPVPDGFTSYDLKTEDGLNNACKHFERLMCGEDKIASQALGNLVSSENALELVSSGDMLTDAYFENLQKVSEAQQELANNNSNTAAYEAQNEISMNMP